MPKKDVLPRISDCDPTFAFLSDGRRRPPIVVVASFVEEIWGFDRCHGLATCNCESPTIHRVGAIVFVLGTWSMFRGPMEHMSSATVSKEVPSLPLYKVKPVLV